MGWFDEKLKHITVLHRPDTVIHQPCAENRNGVPASGRSSGIGSRNLLALFFQRKRRRVPGLSFDLVGSAIWLLTMVINYGYNFWLSTTVLVGAVLRSTDHCLFGHCWPCCEPCSALGWKCSSRTSYHASNRMSTLSLPDRWTRLSDSLSTMIKWVFLLWVTMGSYA